MSEPLRIAMLGMIEGNGHPYSWSAIINGFDEKALSSCPYPTIQEYLRKQDVATVSIGGAEVTHVWTDDSVDAPEVAALSRIANVVKTPTDVIGSVDAVIIATDDGEDHVRRARPFVEAGLPVFIDKPLATNVPDLKQFFEWEQAGAFIVSSSGMRYAPELDCLAKEMPDVGIVRWVSSFTCKTWERYGIHALEALHPLLKRGVQGVRLETGINPDSDIAYMRTVDGVDITIPVCSDAYGSFGTIQICGTEGSKSIRLSDTYITFRKQMLAFITAVRTGTPPCPFRDTVGYMEVIIAGIRSRQEGSRFVEIEEIRSELAAETNTIGEK